MIHFAGGDNSIAVVDTKTSAAAVVAVSPTPQALEFRQGLVGAVASFTGITVSQLKRGAGVAFASTLSVAPTVSEAGAKADGAIAAVGAEIGAVHKSWSARWAAAFTPNNTMFSGHLPVLNATATPSTIQRTYYLSCVSFLSIYKLVDDTHTPTQWTRSFTTGGPRTAITAMYYWDMPYQSTLLSLLDPQYVKYYIRQVAKADLSQTNSLDYMSGAGGGRWYVCFLTNSTH